MSPGALTPRTHTAPVHLAYTRSVSKTNRLRPAVLPAAAPCGHGAPGPLNATGGCGTGAKAAGAWKRECGWWQAGERIREEGWEEFVAR